MSKLSNKATIPCFLPIMISFQQHNEMTDGSFNARLAELKHNRAVMKRESEQLRAKIIEKSQYKIRQCLCHHLSHIQLTAKPTVAQIKKPQSKLRSRIIHLPCTKIGKETGKDVMICRQAGKTNPISALLHHTSNQTKDSRK